MYKRATLIWLLLLAAPGWATSAAQTPAPSGAPTAQITGHWQGTLQAGMQLTLILHVERHQDQLRATVDSPDQGARGIGVDQISFHNGRLRFAINAIGAAYEATLTGNTLSGIWQQNGARLKLNLQRVATPTVRARPQTPQPPFPYTSTDVRFDSADGETQLWATLTLPPGEGPYTAVVLLSGSGPQDRNATLFDHKPFLVLADHLTRNGFAVLRYDERGVGESSGQFDAATIEHFSRDALGAVEVLAQREDIERIGILGHSEGAMVGDIVAARTADVSFLIRLAGPAVSAQSLLVEQTAAIFKTSGGGHEHTAVLRELNSKLYALAATERSDETLIEAAVATLREVAASLNPAEQTALGLDGELAKKAAALTSPWFRDFIRRDAGDALARVQVPVFALFGSKDTQVVAAQNAPFARRSLVHDYGRTEIYDNLNHLFQHASTGSPNEYAQIEQTLAPQVLDDIVTWLQGLPAAQ